jgi:xanthine dehydrogenase YagT iron-sulfur-binding subunit
MAERKKPGPPLDQETSHNPINPNVSRRSFLKGAGLTAAGTVVLESVSFAASEFTPDAAGPGAVLITLRVNGVVKQLSVEPRTMLSEALRFHLDLTGTKVVCDRGACSSCTVLLDGTPVNSCMTFAMDAVGKEITTIEGISKGGELHPIQAAFIEHDGLQCGYCTSGMVMSCFSLLSHNPHPTREDVQQAVSGNLCRCGTYPKVFEAAMNAISKRKQEGM